VTDHEAVSIVSDIITRQETAIRQANVRIAEQEAQIVTLRTERDEAYRALWQATADIEQQRTCADAAERQLGEALAALSVAEEKP